MKHLDITLVTTAPNDKSPMVCIDSTDFSYSYMPNGFGIQINENMNEELVKEMCERIAHVIYDYKDLIEKE
jgi:hypothetical protein